MFTWHNLIEFVAVAIGTWLGTRIIQPKDHERAALLSRIATESAALALSMFPNAPWSTLVKEVVAMIAAAAGVPTKNASAIERAAAAALLAVGKRPDA